MSGPAIPLFSRCLGTSASGRVRGPGLHAPFVPKWRLRAPPLSRGHGRGVGCLFPRGRHVPRVLRPSQRAGILAPALVVGGSRVTTACDVASLVEEGTLCILKGLLPHAYAPRSRGGGSGDDRNVVFVPHLSPAGDELHVLFGPRLVNQLNVEMGKLRL